MRRTSGLNKTTKDLELPQFPDGTDSPREAIVDKRLFPLMISFCVDEIQQINDSVIKFQKLTTDKPELKNKFCYCRYDDDTVNEELSAYYAAKFSADHSTFGGPLPLINEFISSTVLNIISSLSNQKFIAPRVLIYVENVNGRDGFRLLSKMVEGFKPISQLADIDNMVAPKLESADSLPKRGSSAGLRDSDHKPAIKNICYAAGVMTAIQEIDPNLRNYGTVVIRRPNNNDGKIVKIDTNSDYRPTRRAGDNHKTSTPHGGIYFNHLQRSDFQEVSGMEAIKSISFGAYVAKKLVFKSMNDKQILRFVGEGCLEIKEGCENNFKHFMAGINDFITIPDELIEFIKHKTYADLAVKNKAVADQEMPNINKSCDQLLALKSALSEYFKSELKLFEEKFPNLVQTSIWNEWEKFYEAQLGTAELSFAPIQTPSTHIAAASNLELGRLDEELKDRSSSSSSQDSPRG